MSGDGRVEVVEVDQRFDGLFVVAGVEVVPGGEGEALGEMALLAEVHPRVGVEAAAPGDGGAIAAEASALSADHREYTSDAGVAAMARAGTVAVLLPGAFYALRETRLPPVAAFRREGVPMAISTDCNPGTSPATSLLLMLNMACTLFRLTPAEALAGATEHAARALGLAARGVVAPGLRADLALYAVASPAELAYRIGGNPCVGVVRGGDVLRWRDE